MSSKTSSISLQDVFAKCLLEVVLQTPWRRCLANTSWRCLEDVLKMSCSEDEKLLRWKRLKDFFKMSLKTRYVCWFSLKSFGNSWGNSHTRVKKVKTHYKQDCLKIFFPLNRSLVMIQILNAALFYFENAKPIKKLPPAKVKIFLIYFSCLN